MDNWMTIFSLTQRCLSYTYNNFSFHPGFTLRSPFSQPIPSDSNGLLQQRHLLPYLHFWRALTPIQAKRQPMNR